MIGSCHISNRPSWWEDQESQNRNIKSCIFWPPGGKTPPKWPKNQSAMIKLCYISNRSSWWEDWESQKKSKKLPILSTRWQNTSKCHDRVMSYIKSIILMRWLRISRKKSCLFWPPGGKTPPKRPKNQSAMIGLCHISNRPSWWEDRESCKVPWQSHVIYQINHLDERIENLEKKNWKSFLFWPPGGKTPPKRPKN